MVYSPIKTHCIMSTNILKEFDEAFYALGRRFNDIYSAGIATKAQMKCVEDFWIDEKYFDAFVKSHQALRPSFEEAFSQGLLSSQEFETWDKAVKNAYLQLCACQICASITAEDVSIREGEIIVTMRGVAFETKEYTSKKFDKFKVDPSTLAEKQDDEKENKDDEIEKE